MIAKTKKIWMDGQLVDWQNAQIHVLTHTLHYGLGVFEGIRCYRCHDGRSAIFRLAEHINRLFDSAHISQIDVPFSREEITGAVIETMKVNELSEGYIRPIIYIGDGYSDFCPSKFADLVFAKNLLFQRCQQKGIPCIPFKDFSDINAYLVKNC